MVKTSVCGTENQGSIPCTRPNNTRGFVIRLCGEMDITLGFGPSVLGSSPNRGTSRTTVLT